MTRPTVSEFNVSTQELIIREMTDEEYSLHLNDFEDMQEKMAEQSAKAAAKAELLAALNLSQETLDLLNGLN